MVVGNNVPPYTPDKNKEKVSEKKVSKGNNGNVSEQQQNI